MSRYDGLIIPRSYSEYINKTDAATLLQALQQSGVMDAAPTAGSNHPVKSDGIAQKTLGVFSSGDFNNIKTYGVYRFNGATVSAVPTVALIDNKLYGILEVADYGAGIIQRLSAYKNGTPYFYVRKFNNNSQTWGDWFKNEFITSTELEENTDLDSLIIIGIFGLNGAYSGLPLGKTTASGILTIDIYPPYYNSYIQTLKVFESGKAFVYIRRRFNGGAWGDWYPLTDNLTTAESIAGTYGANNDVVYKKTIITTMPNTTTGTMALKDIDIGITPKKILRFEGAVTNASGAAYQYPLPYVHQAGYKFICNLFNYKLRIGSDFADVNGGEVRVTIYYTK